MIVGNYTHGEDGGLIRTSAEIQWEDCERPVRRLFYETDSRFASAFGISPNTWLLATLIPAMHHGERRVRIEGAICPLLRNGLETVRRHLCVWYGMDKHKPIMIEPTGGFVPYPPPVTNRAAFFYSGGVDSLATLYCNRRDFPIGHPGRIHDGIFVHGIDIGGYEQFDDNRGNSEHTIVQLTDFAVTLGVTPIPVFTNIRFLDDSDDLFFREWHGAVLSSVAHLFEGHITDALIASGTCVEDLGAVGSHPLLDPNFGSSRLRIHHDGNYLGRLNKIGLLSRWPEALCVLRSCYNAFRGRTELNCGRCEKCLRTMTGLLIHGCLGDCPTYPYEDLSPEILDQLIGDASRIRRNPDVSYCHDAYLLISHTNEFFWREMVEPLRRIGRDDLARVIEMKLAEYARSLKRRRIWGRAYRRLKRMIRR